MKGARCSILANVVTSRFTLALKMRLIDRANPCHSTDSAPITESVHNIVLNTASPIRRRE